MGFRGFCLLLVAGFLAGCGSDVKNPQGPYSGSNPNQNQMPPIPNEGPSQTVKPPMQATNTDGAAIGPTTDFTDNPILTPSGVTGLPTDPMVQPPRVNGGNLVNGPTRAQQNPSLVQLQTDLRGLHCPRTNTPYFDERRVAAQAQWMAQQNISYQNYQWTLLYFRETIIFRGGRFFWAFDGIRSAQLTNMVFRASPSFDIYRFDGVYRQVLNEGFLGYIAIDEALRRMGIRIATCRL